MSILFISFAPIILILIYIYKRDKYEKEPMGLLLISLVAGAVITLPILLVEMFLMELVHFQDIFANAFYEGFIVASMTEELFKYLAFTIFIWRNRNFNELFDGIIYASYISLGFAAVENFFYVYGYGYEVGALRAFTAVPAHALFGITMGYYFGLAKFNESKRARYLWLAIIMPFILHGFYDFFLMSDNGLLLLVFLAFVVFMWISGFKKMKRHSKGSVFKDGPEPKPELDLDKIEPEE
jgi:RsiW-degrading membrane proteinase PrsW (M82 family)